MINELRAVSLIITLIILILSPAEHTGEARLVCMGDAWLKFGPTHRIF
jgi:hypothetical protein